MSYRPTWGLRPHPPKFTAPEGGENCGSQFCARPKISMSLLVISRRAHSTRKKFFANQGLRHTETFLRGLEAHRSLGGTHNRNRSRPVENLSARIGESNASRTWARPRMHCRPVEQFLVDSPAHLRKIPDSKQEAAGGVMDQPIPKIACRGWPHTALTRRECHV